MSIWRRVQRLDNRVFKARYSPRSDNDRQRFLSDLGNMRSQSFLGYGEYTRPHLTELAREVMVLREQVNLLIAERRATVVQAREQSDLRF
jgi:hypothetical protein